MTFKVKNKTLYGESFGHNKKKTMDQKSQGGETMIISEAHFSDSNRNNSLVSNTLPMNIKSIKPDSRLDNER